MKKLFVMILMALLATFVFAADVKPEAKPDTLVTFRFLDGTVKQYTMEQLKAYNDISRDFQPRILPVVTGAIGVLSGFVAATAAGASVPIVGITMVIDGIIYYFYGYGITRFFDEYLLDVTYTARVRAELKAQAYYLEEGAKKGYKELVEGLSRQ